MLLKSYEEIEGNLFCSNEGAALKICENTLTRFKSLLPRPTGPNSTLSWVKGIQVYSFEGPCPFPREYNNQLAKIHSLDKI